MRMCWDVVKKSTLEHTPIFLKCMVNEHVIINLVSLGKKLSTRHLLIISRAHVNNILFNIKVKIHMHVKWSYRC